MKADSLSMTEEAALLREDKSPLPPQTLIALRRTALYRTHPHTNSIKAPFVRDYVDKNEHLHRIIWISIFFGAIYLKKNQTTSFINLT